MSDKGEGKKPTSYSVSTRVTMPMYRGIEEIIDSGAYFNVTDYLRNVIRADLKRRGLLQEPGAEAP